MRHLILSTIILLTYSCAAWPQSLFFSAEVDTALHYLGMSLKDFESDRIWAEDDTFLLPEIRESLRSPLSAYEVSCKLSAATPTSVEEAGKINELCALLAAKCPDFVCRDTDAQLKAAKPTAIDPFEPMLSAIALAEGYRAQAFSSLTDAERRSLLMAIPLWFEDEDDIEDDSLKGMLYRAFGSPIDTTAPVDADSVLTLLSRVNRDALSAAIYAFARGLALTVEAWKTVKPPFSSASVPGVSGFVLAARESPYGSFVIGGGGPNTYSGDFALILDVGGDDLYLGRAGAAAHALGSGVSAILDFGGNDRYGSGLIADQACGILGIGGLVDLNGNDDYRSRAFGQSAAFCGAALLFDGGGDDTYRCTLFGQGAAVCGVAVLVDESGRDVYDLGQYGQGFASTFGAGVLLDKAGNDLYRAGGTSFHAPLLPEDYRSFAQGYSIGSRPRAGGGFGLLHDVSGNDFYNAEVYAQGVGYWYSLGAIMDDSGNDVYNATQYSQGAGIHLAAGVLVDQAGDDRYHSRFGPGQGSAHDLSVGILLERGGDDQYTLSGGQAVSLTNSAAIALDLRGNDFYNTTEPDLGQGGVREARGFGNLSVFVDAEGRDHYPQRSQSDSSVWVRGLYAVGCDLSYDSLRPREAPVNVQLDPADTLRPIEDLFRDAALWEVTDNRVKVRRARLALNAKGAEAVRWVGQNKLNTIDALERRAIIELFKTLPDSAAPYLSIALSGVNPAARRNAIVAFGEMKYRAALPLLTEKLSDQSYSILRPAILTALGEIGDTSAVRTVAGFARSTIERERIAAIVSLGKLADLRTFHTVASALDDTLYTVRSAAVIAVSNYGTNVIPSLQQELKARESGRLEPLLIAIGRLCERWNKDEKLAASVAKLMPLIQKYLEYPEPRVQAAALVASSAVMSARDVARVVARLDASADPLVKARVNQVKSLRN